MSSNTLIIFFKFDFLFQGVTGFKIVKYPGITAEQDYLINMNGESEQQMIDGSLYCESEIGKDCLRNVIHYCSFVFDNI